MRGWYVPGDVLEVAGEHVLDETVGLEEAVATILHISGLAGRPALTPCPTRCPRCAAEAAPGTGQPVGEAGNG
jgi:hypothetical protein